MISLEEIKQVINERRIKAYGLNYQQFLSLPKDFQIAILSKYFETNGINIDKNDDKMIKGKIKVLLKRNK